MKKKYLCIVQNSNVNKNNFVYFSENLSNFLSFLVKKNDFVVKNKFGINLVLVAFILFSIGLSFLF